MDRIEKVRNIVDEVILSIADVEERKRAYIHIYGVSQACALLAMKRNVNVELAVVAGMLHDIYLCTNKEDGRNHACKGAERSRDILDSLNLFSEEEITLICTAIHNHSDKAAVHNSFDELLKDADVLQHVLHKPLQDIEQRERKRFVSMEEEFDLER